MKIYSNRVELQGSELSFPSYTYDEVNGRLSEDIPINAENIGEAIEFVKCLRENGWNEACGVCENGMTWAIVTEETSLGSDVVLIVGDPQDTGIYIRDNPLGEYDFSDEYNEEREFNAMLKSYK